MEYAHSFFYECIEESVEADKNSIVNSALAHRGSKADDFTEFVDMVNGMGKPQEVDHSANLALLKGELS